MERKIQGKKPVAMEMVDVLYSTYTGRGPGLRVKFGGNSIPAIIGKLRKKFVLRKWKSPAG